MNSIEVQSGYDFWYNKNTITELEKITVDIESQSLNSVLNTLFTPRRVSFELVDKTIFLKPRADKNPFRTNDENIRRIPVEGSVRDEQGKPIPKATIGLKGTNIFGIAGDSGEFSMNVPENSTLVISSLGYRPEEVVIPSGHRGAINIVLRVMERLLDDVEIVSTGYQNLPRERATGSFTQIDHNLLNRNGTTANILDRIDGISSGVIFNNNGAKQFRQSELEVRGRSTLFSNAAPLIVLDNFPYDGDPANINPNDIESISILKDAAAASAWGARSGNGVIVITTKKGRLNSAPQISINSAVTVGQKPDLFYPPQLGTSQFIEVQQFLFDKGAYNTIINNGYGALSPAVDIMLARRNGSISEQQQHERLDQLRSYDVREQLLEYYYVHPVQQLYQGSISGGTDSQKYFVSVGYNKNLGNVANSEYNRKTLNASNTYLFLKNRLELFTNIMYTGSGSKNGPALSASFPYTQFADASGNSLAVDRDLRFSYAGTAGDGKLLNWLYRPLDELRNGYGTAKNDLASYRLNVSLGYDIFKGLRASLLYGYEKSSTDINTLNELDSYYTRNQINRVTQISQTTGAVAYPLPIGGILFNSSSNLKSQNGRAQISYSGTFKKHSINTLAGLEIRDQSTNSATTTLFGYNPENLTNQNGAVNYLADLPLFYNPSATVRLNPNQSQGGFVNRFFSYYFNGSYVYDQRYIFSLSARRDESNLFGVATNQKGVPLWSAGLAWNVNKEKFYALKWLPTLKLRGTFGYTGNVNNTVSAYLTSSTTVLNDYNGNYGTIINPPNPNLRWEKTGNINFGLDFGSIGNRISGSIDYWQKEGIDLIGNSPLAPQTGIVLYTGNSANTRTKGIDIQITTVNIDGALEWSTTLLYNVNRSRVTDYKVSNGTNLNVVSSNYNNPLEGYPFYALFSFKYEGLDNTGSPRGILNQQVSTNYSGIMNSVNRDELIYHGSAAPTTFGSLRNTFTFKDFDLSFNILFKLNYYFRRGSLNNSSLYTTGNSYQMADYENRWQAPGDEQRTNVPALIYPAQVNRTNLYTYSEVLIEKADHFRFQDLRLGYNLRSRNLLPLRNLTVFAYLSNLGIIWRANRYNIDPDNPAGLPAVKTFAIGLKADL